MKKNLLTVLVLVLFGTTQLFAQKDVVDLLKAGKEDAQVLGKAYLEPFGGLLGRSLNGGWYNTASVHKFPGFDITFGINVAMASSSVKSFDLNDYLSDLTYLTESNGWRLENPDNHLAPTISGKMKNQRPAFVKNDEKIIMPDGVGVGIMPIPMIQAGIGLPFHTEIIGRFFPTVKLGSYGKVGIWGIGLKHEIKEYLPVIKHLPIIQSSIILGYTKLGLNANINYAEVSGVSDQKLDFGVSSFTGRLLVGVNVPIISVYMGLGYGNSKSDFNVKGTYKVGNDTEPQKDPLSLEYKYNNFDANIGLRLKFGVVTLHGDYTFGDYSVVSAGLGISFR